VFSAGEYNKDDTDAASVSSRPWRSSPADLVLQLKGTDRR